MTNIKQDEVVQEAEVIKPNAEDFAKEYQALCEKLGFRIVVSPQYIARDDGSFSTVLQYTVGALKRENEQSK